MTRNRSTPLLDQLATHTAAITTANQRTRSAELDYRNAQAEVNQTREQRVQALAVGDDDLAARLQAEHAEAERKVRDLADRLDAAQLAVHRAVADRRRFVATSIDALLSEHERVNAQPATDAVVDALAALAAAHGRWLDAEARTVELLRLADRGHERTPGFPADLADAIRRISKAQTDVPLPLPVGRRRAMLESVASRS